MIRLALGSTCLGITLLIAACTADRSQAVMNKEDMLIASGFKFVPANTPERQAAFRKLPPHKFTREIRGEKVIYVYADPTVCVCIYVGGQAAYASYRKNVFDKQLADEQATVASDTYYMNQWDWSVWSTGLPAGWPYNYYY